MGLLDELRSEAQVLRASQIEEQTESERIKQIYLTQVRPRLRTLYLYLKELVEHLNYLDRAILVSYQLPGSEKRFDLLQKDYVITADSGDNMSNIKLRFIAVADRPLFVPTASETEADQAVLTLRQHDLIGVKRRNVGRHIQAPCIVEVSPRIPITLEFDSNPGSTSLVLRAKNFDKLGEVRRHFSPEDLTDQWLEDIGDLIIRKRNVITRHELSEEQRARLKAHSQGG
jgi:hypothetical protein